MDKQNNPTHEHHVDYDVIAPEYNARFEDSNEYDGLQRPLMQIARDIDAARILEVGCGTAHWLERLAPAADSVYGLDLSAGMLRIAQWSIQPLRLLQGRAGQLPFAAGSFDLIYAAHAIHHFHDQRGFIMEARRLLQEGGALAVLGADPHIGIDEWYVYDYFEGTRQTDLERFPSSEQILTWMGEAGFGRITQVESVPVLNPVTGADIFDHIDKHSCSQLALLSDEAYVEGLRRVRIAIAEAEVSGDTVIFPMHRHRYIWVGYV
jgi:SAM-dependent methyltransferase